MRLIDADKFLDFISNLPKCQNGHSKAYSEADICKFIDCHPTAYDVDKVVERLGEESKRWKDSGEEYEGQKEIGTAEGFKKAIEIVKSGGIE